MAPTKVQRDSLRNLLGEVEIWFRSGGLKVDDKRDDEDPRVSRPAWNFLNVCVRLICV